MNKILKYTIDARVSNRAILYIRELLESEYSFTVYLSGYEHLRTLNIIIPDLLTEEEIFLLGTLIGATFAYSIK